MQSISQNQIQSVVPQLADAAIIPSEHPEVLIPQELHNTIAKGSDAQELKVEKAATPTITTPTGAISLPLTYEQALQKKNTTGLWDSMHWLASAIIYQWTKYDPDVVKASKIKAKTKT